MGIVRKKEIAGKEFEIKEATVEEIRNWLKELGDERQGDVVDILLIEGFFIPDLYWFTTITPTDAAAMTPRELQEAITEVKELNPDFFGLQTKLLARWQEKLDPLVNGS